MSVAALPLQPGAMHVRPFPQPGPVKVRVEVCPVGVSSPLQPGAVEVRRLAALLRVAGTRGRACKRQSSHHEADGK